MLSHTSYICGPEHVLKFRDVTNQVVFSVSVDSTSLTPLHKVLPDDLSVADTNWLLAVAMSLVTPYLCVVVATYVTRFWKTDQVVTNSISSNNDFKY